ncbi:hypothetical protein COL11_00045 [Bacillus anthracis]|nr:hypothetical protein COL11_00045 [Bacillus anthracis]
MSFLYEKISIFVDFLIYTYLAPYSIINVVIIHYFPNEAYIVKTLFYQDVFFNRYIGLEQTNNINLTFVYLFIEF